MLRTRGGFAGWTDQQLLDLPYARLLQATRVAVREVERAERARMTEAAFIGFQTASAFGSLKKNMTFDKYLAQLGLKDQKSEVGKIQREREKARETAARVATLFNQGPLRKEQA